MILFYTWSGFTMELSLLHAKLYILCFAFFFLNFFFEGEADLTLSFSATKAKQEIASIIFSLMPLEFKIK